MKKTFKLMGIALLAAGVSFAVSSCEKEVAAVPEEDVAVEETVDFEEITKCDFEDIDKAVDQTKKAIDGFVKGVAGLFDKETQEKIQSELFDTFTSVFAFTATKNINISDVFYTTLKFVVAHTGDENEEGNYVEISCSEGYFNFITADGYYLKVGIPGWKAWVDEETAKPTSLESGFSFVPGLNYYVELGEKSEAEVGGEDIVYAKAFLSFDDDDAANVVVKLYYEGRVLGASYDFCEHTLIMDATSLEVWFSNYVANGADPEGLSSTSDIKMKNLDDVFWALNQITADTYSYTKDDADAIVETFKNNVTSAYPDYVQSNMPQVRGKRMWAEALQDTEYTQLYRVVVYYARPGEETAKKIVTPGKVIQVLKDKWKEIFGDGNLVGVPFEPKQD